MCRIEKTNMISSRNNNNDDNNLIDNFLFIIGILEMKIRNNEIAHRLKNIQIIEYEKKIFDLIFRIYALERQNEKLLTTRHTIRIVFQFIGLSFLIVLVLLSSSSFS